MAIVSTKSGFIVITQQDEVEYERMLEKEDTDGCKWISKPSGISNAKIKRVGLMLRQETIKLERMLTVVY